MIHALLALVLAHPPAPFVVLIPVERELRVGDSIPIEPR
jgi:hypothetical protein